MSNHESCQAVVERTGEPNMACLQRAAEHVAHDLYLLRHAWVDRNLRIGWTLWFITARVLMDFFFRHERQKNKDGKYSDDILAGDFLPKEMWKPFAEMLESEQPAEWAACRLVANKLSAHLTYSRVHLSASGPTPPSGTVHDYLLGVAGMWLDKMPPEHRAWFDPWFPTHAAKQAPGAVR